MDIQGICVSYSVEVYPLSLVLSDVYAYEPNTLKSTRIKWAGHVACIVGKPGGKRPLVDGRITLEWILDKQSVKL
jgi:hypothetical protein